MPMLAGTSVAFHTFEVGAHVGDALIAEVAVFFHRLGDDEVEFGRNFRIQANHGSGVLMKNLVEDGAGALTFEGENSSGHFVQDDTKGKEVGACVEFFAEDLLWGHINHGAEGAAGTSELLGINMRR